MAGTQRVGPTVWWVNQFAVSPDGSGGMRHYEMSAALHRRGRNVVVIASDLDLGTRRYTRRRGANDRRYLPEQVNEVPFVWLPAGTYDRNDWRRAVSMLTFAVHASIFLMRNVHPRDVVIGSSPHLPGALASWVISRLRRAQFVHEVRDLWPESLVAVTGRTTVVAGALRLIADLLYRKSDAIVVLASGSADVVVARGAEPSRVHWIPNGVTIDGPTTPLPDELAWVKKSPTFVYAGSHGPANDLDFLLDVAAVLQSSDDLVAQSIRVLLVGDGVERKRLMQRASDEALSNVVFHPPITKASLRTLLNSSSGGLMILKDVPLFRFGVSPNKLFDYLAADLPVITNVAGDVAQTVTRSGSGIAVPPNDVVGFADAMRRIASEGWPSGRGKDFVRKHYAREILAQQMDSVLARLA